MKIKTGCKGRILKGAHAGWYVFIEDRGADEGGYLILIVDSEDFDTARVGFDQWVENYRNLEAQIEYYGWEIEWLGCSE